MLNVFCHSKSGVEIFWVFKNKKGWPVKKEFGFFILSSNIFSSAPTPVKNNNLSLSTKLHVIFFIGPYPEPYLVGYTDDLTIIAVDLTTLHTKVLLSGLRHLFYKARLVQMVVDYIGMKLYFTHRSRICRAYIDGSAVEIIPSQRDISTFALDWIGRRLFWVQSRSKRIYVASGVYLVRGYCEIYAGSLDLKSRRRLLTHDRTIYSLELDPNKR